MAQWKCPVCSANIIKSTLKGKENIHYCKKCEKSWVIFPYKDIEKTIPKITAYKNITDACEWYLKEVSEFAMATQLFTYFQDNNIIGNKLGIDPMSISKRMRVDPRFEKKGVQNKRIIWGLKSL